jgi:hypothetical protein
VTVVSGEAPALGTAPMVEVMTGGPPPSNNLMWDVLVQQVDSASSSGNGG